VAKRKRKLDPHRFVKQDEQPLFAFDPIRRELFQWGMIAGAIGGLFLSQEGFIWQILGYLIIFLIMGRRVDKAAQRIPRWHAIVITFVGTLPVMILVIFFSRLILANLGGGTPTP